MGYGTSLGTAHEDEISYVMENGLSGKQLDDAKEMAANETSGDFQSRFYATDASTMPLEASRKLTDALKASQGIKTPEKALEDQFVGKLKEGSAKIDSMWNLFRGNETPPTTPRDASKDIYVNPQVTITPEDIEKGINVGLGAGPGSIENAGKYKNYIDMFVNPKPVDKTQAIIDEIAKHLDNPAGEVKPVTKFEQQPLLDTQDAASSNWTKDQLHPDNFHSINQNILSLKQAQDLHDTWHYFKTGTLSKGEYLDEMAEYEKFSNMSPSQYKAKNIPINESTNEAEMIEQWKIMHGDETWGPIEPMSHGQKVLNDILDDYPEVLNSIKATPKEKFLEHLDRINNTLNTTFANIRDKFVNTVKESKLEPKLPVLPEAAAKGYTESAYRGLKVYPGKETNPVFNFHTDPFNPEHDIGGMYSTSSPMLADMYTDYLSHHPGYKVPEGAFKEGSQVMPLYINTKDYHYYDAKGDHWTNANGKAILQAQAKGKKGVVVDNVRDEPNSTTTLPPKKIFITFKSGAGTVKSRFAKNFDPSSPNILHGIGSVAVAGAAAGYLTDEADRN